MVEIIAKNGFSIDIGTLAPPLSDLKQNRWLWSGLWRFVLSNMEICADSKSRLD